MYALKNEILDNLLDTALEADKMKEEALKHGNMELYTKLRKLTTDIFLLRKEMLKAFSVESNKI